MTRQAPSGGRVVFVGTGPGDPGLVTDRGTRLLAEAHLVVLDQDAPSAIADLLPEGCGQLRVPPGQPASWLAERLGAAAREGRRVVRLLPGDGAGFGPEAEALAAAGVAFDVVPGVTPAVAAAVGAGVSWGGGPGGEPALIVEGPEDRAVDWVRVAPVGSTVVAGVVAEALEAAVEGLRAGGHPAEAPGAVVPIGPWPPRVRSVVGPLGGLLARVRERGLRGPVVLVVGPALRQQPRLAWLEGQALFGRRIVVTRPRAQVAALAALLEAEGATVVALPTIRLEPPADWGPLDDAIGRLGAFGWVLFTSTNGVAAFRERLVRARLDARALGHARVGAIGPGTAEALEGLGLRADVVPAEYRAEGLLEALRPHVGPGTRVLLVRAAEAREVLPRGLRGLGAETVVVPAYRAVRVTEGAERVVGLLETRQVDAVTFSSSSTVHGFVALLPAHRVRQLLAGVVLAAIGPITAATLGEYGLEAQVVASDYTIPALAAALAAHFGRAA